MATFTENRGQCGCTCTGDVKCVIISVFPRGKHRGQSLPHTLLLWASSPLLVPPTLIPPFIFHGGPAELRTRCLTKTREIMVLCQAVLPTARQYQQWQMYEGKVPFKASCSTPQHISGLRIKTQALFQVILPSQQLCYSSVRGDSAGGVWPHLSSLKQRSELPGVWHSEKGSCSFSSQENGWGGRKERLQSLCSLWATRPLF